MRYNSVVNQTKSYANYAIENGIDQSIPPMLYDIITLHVHGWKEWINIWHLLESLKCDSIYTFHIIEISPYGQRVNHGWVRCDWFYVRLLSSFDQ